MAVATATLATAALATAAVGTGISAYGMYQQGQTAKRAGEYNAKLAEVEAMQAEAESRENLKRSSQNYSAFMGTQRTQMAATGAQLGEGTPLQIEADTAGQVQLAQLDSAVQSQNRIAGIRAQGAMARWQGRQQSAASYIGAAGTLFSGAGNIGISGAQLKASGAFKKTG